MRSSIGVILIAVFGLAAGCHRPPEPPRKPRRGAECVVQLRDALGVAADAPGPPMMGTTKGSAETIIGRFLDENREWVVLEVDETLAPNTPPAAPDEATASVKIEFDGPLMIKREYWIPKQSILLMSVAAPEKPGKAKHGPPDGPPR